MSTETQLYRVRPQTYLHVLDQITNVTRVEIGPQTLICKRHEMVVTGPHDMVSIPPRHYCKIENPITKDDEGNPTFDKHGMAILNWGECEYRLAQDPFPLYPGEMVKEKISKLKMVYKNTAFHLLCLEDFVDHQKAERKVGDQYLFEGPGQYIPSVQEQVVTKIEAIVIKQNQALHLTALEDCKDREGNARVAGEEWIVRTIGAYLPGVYERKIKVIPASVLTDKKALHVKALRTFTDETGKERHNGEQWLVTSEQTETYIPSVHEEISRRISITTLNSRQFCVIEHPFDPETGTNRWGGKQLVVGEKSFFLHPFERLSPGVQSVHVLNEEQGLVLTCEEEFVDTMEGKKITRRPGDRWMIQGPMEFIPPIGAIVVRTNKAIALGENEGIYVRNITTGEISAKIGETYLLNEDEEKWEKKLPQLTEELLASTKGMLFVGKQMSPDFIAEIKSRVAKRDKTRVVTYNVPHNHAVQLYDFREETGRTVFGPSLVLLQPGETITALTLSGSKPKKANCVKCLHLRLGPEFSSDVITVETSDHCKLRIHLSYNWAFDVKDVTDQTENSKLFAVEDFVGDMCKTISSRIRAAVSAVPFDSFHKTSAKLIRTCVFGRNDKGQVGDRYFFPSNNLVVTSIDVRSIEPEDAKTREALQQSVQLAIEITAKAQEAAARHQQAQLEQEATGKLESQRLVDKAEAEISNKKFIEAQVATKAVQNTGKAKAEAESKAEMVRIAAQGAVDQAKLAAEAKTIAEAQELAEEDAKQNSEVEYSRSKNELSRDHAKTLADIDVKRFSDMSTAIGPETLAAIGSAGPALSKQLLKGLGVKETFFADSGLPFISE